MYSLGGFPGILSGDGVVHGEVYEIEDRHLPNLDGLEGYYPEADDGMYLRREVELDMPDDPFVFAHLTLKAYVYIWNRGDISENRLIKDGVWQLE
jgi:gamma-glutamylcyclotransferase (GGCT)/AIG2-like uncharacterized protein YtfP